MDCDKYLCREPRTSLFIDGERLVVEDLGKEGGGNDVVKSKLNPNLELERQITLAVLLHIYSTSNSDSKHKVRPSSLYEEIRNNSVDVLF